MSVSGQRGTVTLLVGLMLLIGSSILTLGVVRIGVMEQRMANNDLRAKEAHQAAQAGLEYALAWLTLNAWESDSAIPSPPEIAASGEYRYGTELAVSETPGCLRVSSRAHAIGDESITAFVSECHQQKRLFHDGMGLGAPPLIVNGCLSGITGNPDIYPAVCGPGGDSDCETIAVASSREASCLDTGHLNLNGGKIDADAFEGTAWDYLFAVRKEDVQALADQAGTNVHWISSSSPWDKSLGSAASPVVLVFDETAGCPKLNGKPTIYGIVYYEAPDDCAARGWGGATVYGSVVFEGSLEKLTANSVFEHWSRTGESGETAALNPVHSTQRVPGSWRDWEPAG